MKSARGRAAWNAAVSLGGGLVLLTVAGLLTGGCEKAVETKSTKLRAVVSVLPLGYMAQRIGNGYVDTVVLIGPGQEPHTYEPTPRQVAEASHADLYFNVGLPLETRLVEKLRSMNPNLKVLDLRDGIKLRMLTEEEVAADEDLAPGRQKGQGASDPHIWLSPKNAQVISATMCKAMTEADPAHAAEYEKNLKTFDAELGEVDTRIAALLAPFKGREFMTYHPAFGYFGDAYGLKQTPVEIEGKEPGPRTLGNLIKQAKDRGVRMIFVQPQFSDKAARAIAQAIGGAVVPMDDLSGDYLKNLQQMAEEVQKAVEREKAP